MPTVCIGGGKLTGGLVQPGAGTSAILRALALPTDRRAFGAELGSFNLRIPYVMTATLTYQQKAGQKYLCCYLSIG